MNRRISNVEYRSGGLTSTLEIRYSVFDIQKCVSAAHYSILLLITFTQILNLKILILRFSSIGDIVLSSPAVRCLKKQVPGAEIHFATKALFKDIIEPNVYIDKKFYLQNSLRALIKQLRAEKYDVIIDLHNNLRTLLVKLQLKAPSFSFNKLNFRKWLMVNLKWNVLPQKHIVDRYIETAKQLSVKNDGEGLDYFFTPGEKIDIAGLPLTHIHGFVAVAIGAKHYTKKLPAKSWLPFAKKLMRPLFYWAAPKTPL